MIREHGPMATQHLRLRRKKSDGYYYTAWVDDHGKRRTRSFGTKRAPAERRFAAFRTQWASDPEVRTPTLEGPLTIDQAWAKFETHAKAYYRRADGTPTGEATNLEEAFQPVRDTYGHEPAARFTPGKLRSIQKGLVKQQRAVSTINARIRRIRQIFKWLAGQELVPVGVWHGLQAVEAVRAGRGVEVGGQTLMPKVKAAVSAVPDAHVWAVCGHVPPTVAAMIRVQYWTGMRPGEVCQMRPVDLDTSGKVWLYRPERHKTQHHGKTRVILIGPHAQEVIRPFLSRDVTACLFSPREAMRQRFDAKVEGHDPGEKHDYRRWASYQARRATYSPTRYRDHYTPQAYGYCIKRACEDHDIPHWSPNQLRHNAATRIRKEFGLDVAQVVLGHSTADVTQMYADLDQDKAAKVIERVG